MGADNFEQLGFQVKIDGATDAVNHLDDIIARLERIQKLQNESGNGRSKSKKGGVATHKQIFQEDVETARQKGNRQAYTNLLNLISKEEELNHVYAAQIETYRQLLSLKEKMFSYNVSTRNDVQDLTVATEIAKAQAKAQQLANNLKDENFRKSQQELAVENEKLRVLKKQAVEEERRKQNPPLTEEEKFRNSFEKSKRRREFGIQEGYIQEKQNLSEIEKYLQKVNKQKDLLNSKTYEEARRIELANQQRKKEIDQRLKQELGIKQTTKSLTAYLAKLSSGVMIARRLGSFVSSAIQESANYVENLNLFAVAYGDVYQETLKWALDLADGFGLASNEVLKFAGTFRQLSTSLGLVEDTANSVSQTVTQLGYDMSALFNTSVENAMEKLQSGLFSGNVRPLRAYGIDISQNQIDALFETNQALASLGVNARDLSQSDKVLARLIITLRDGSNAFGTMNREINTLQSQIRILQGSFSNFKLAIGDLVREPVREALTYLNAFIIAMTSVIRAFHPLQNEDENAFTVVAMGAEEANEAIDELNGKLADFDKFNVLGGQSQGGDNLAVTEALTAELKKQQEIYQAQIDAISKIKNEAVEMSKGIVGWFIEVDEKGNILYKDDMPIWTDNAKILGSTLTVLTGIIGLKVIDSILGLVKNIFTLKNGMILLNTVLVSGAIFAFVKMVEAFENGEYWAGILAGAIGITLVGAFVLLHKKAIVGAIGAIVKFIAELWFLNATALGSTTLAIGALSGAFIGLSAAIAGAFAIFSNWGDMNGWQKTIGIIGVATTAILGLAMAFGVFHSAWSLGLAAAGIAAGIGAIIASIATVKKEVETPVSHSAHANGGYTNANLIMTHENGKREWVGKAAGSSAIVNDTQMSDIMETAVAKGVYRALSSSRTDGSSGGTTKNVYNFQVNGRTLLSVMEDEARKQGKALTRI